MYPFKRTVYVNVLMIFIDELVSSLHNMSDSYGAVCVCVKDKQTVKYSILF